jgi:predicted TPR repeat methyltransferase
MLAKARERRVYDELRREDVHAALGRKRRACDLILAADVFVYIGDLDPVFAGCRRALRPGGMFLFTTESDDVAGYAVSPHGRFVHAPDYVLGMAATHGFALLARESIPLRREHGSILAGDLFGLGA